MGAAAGASILLVSAFAGHPPGPPNRRRTRYGGTVRRTRWPNRDQHGDLDNLWGRRRQSRNSDHRVPARVLVPPGTIHATDTVAAQAQSDLTTAYLDAAGRTPFTVESADLGGQTLAPGVYEEAALTLTGTSRSTVRAIPTRSSSSRQGPRSPPHRTAPSASLTAHSPATCSGRWVVRRPSAQLPPLSAPSWRDVGVIGHRRHRHGSGARSKRRRHPG